MDRRRFLLTSLAGALAAPLAADAQHATPAVIGVLATTPLTDAVQGTIRRGLAEHGYVERRDVVIEWRSAENRRERLAALATELVELKVQVIVALLTPAVQAAKNATSTIPIVMAPAGDPVGSGFVTSLARPGRNVTGVTGIGDQLAGKQLEALRQVVPRLVRLALLVNPAGDVFSKTLTAQAEAAAKTSGVTLHVINVLNAEELNRMFEKIVDHHDEGVMVQGPIFTASFGRIAQLGLRYHLPSVSAPKEFAEAGGLLAYGASQIDLVRRAMLYVARILRGAKPADLPVEQPTKFELVINLKTAKALGLAIPPSLLLRADQVIE
jgi:putative tryptophan/tyrosine transport system substrate-binding protein